jgi:hypothetical protein
MRNHNRLYTLLNVLPDADPVVIEAAYKALMKRYHPDTQPEAASAGRAAELNQAYRTLRDPERRAIYDADEKARQERHRAELSRALSPTAASRPAAPPPRPEPARTGQRAAAWIAAAGILLLVGALYLLARGPSAPVPVANDVVAAQPAEDRNFLRAAAEAFRDQPVDRAQVDKAVSEFRRIAGESGLPGATAYSEHCFDVHARTLAAADYDHCVAFDHVASRGDLRTADNGIPKPEPRFQPQNLINRHVRAAELVADDPGLIESRLFEIRRLTDGAVGRLPAPTPVRLTQAEPPPPPPRRWLGPASRPPPHVQSRARAARFRSAVSSRPRTSSSAKAASTRRLARPPPLTARCLELAKGQGPC